MKRAFWAFPLVGRGAQIPPLLKPEVLEEKYWPFLNSIVLSSTSFFKPSGLSLLDTFHQAISSLCLKQQFYISSRLFYKDFTNRKCSQSLGFLVCLYRANEWHMDRRIRNNSTLLSSGPGLWDLQVLLHHHFISSFKNTVSCMIQVALFQRFRELEGNCPKSHG